ncbi:MAG: DUF2061 domain-containing protein [Burkholderiaceae bacterium]
MGAWKTRSAAGPALTWQATGLVFMTAMNYLYLGDLSQGMGLSLLLTVQGLLAYVVHERLWAKVRWGLQSPIPSAESHPDGAPLPINPHPDPTPESCG